jgi:AraC family transcriptional activator of pyochelin receptor
MDYNTLIYYLPLAFDGLGRGNGAEPGKHYGSAMLAHSHRSFALPTTLRGVRIKKFLGLHFNLGTRMTYKTSDVSGVIRTNHYNLISSPKADYEYSVEKGSYQSFSIHFTLAYLEPLQKYFPILEAFLKKAKSKKIILAIDQHLLCTTEMNHHIHNILHNQHEGAVRNAFLNDEVFDVLLCCLRAITQNLSHAPAKKLALLKIQDVHGYLLLHLQNRLSASFLADKVGLDKNSLRKGFKNLYKMTMLDFLLDARMTKAKVLLRETVMPVNKIAFLIGYKKCSNFSDLFKKKFGVTPTALRKEGR